MSEALCSHSRARLGVGATPRADGTIAPGVSWLPCRHDLACLARPNNIDRSLMSSILPPPGPGAALPLSAPATAEAPPSPLLHRQPPLALRLREPRRSDGWGEIYAALDLGTNNCRLLVARANGSGFRVIDAFSRIVRLGEGVNASGVLSEAAMLRTLDALKVCAGKIVYRGVTRARYVATEACRRAENC